MPKILIEACVDSLAGALAAEQGGAGRIELCAAQEVGGLTPPDDLVRECVGRLTIPVFVLVRFRPGTFELSGAELATLESQVRRVVDLGAAGIVAGALTPQATVDRRAVTGILAAAGSRPLTFHRAFDAITDQLAALEELIDLGVERVLTSGGAPTATEGSERLKALHVRAADRIGILAGGSVRAHNAAALVSRTGVTELHSRTPANADLVRDLVQAANSAPMLS